MPTPKIHSDAAARQRAYRQRLSAARQRERDVKGVPGLPALPTMPGDRRWSALVEHARIALQTARDEMDAYCADRTPSWQEGERGQNLMAHIDALHEAISAVEQLP